MKKNQLVVIVSMCLLFFACWKQSKIENINRPESGVQFAYDGNLYNFSGSEVTTYHIPGDSIYAFICSTNKMKFTFEFISHGFDKDSLLILTGKQFRFSEGIIDYQASNVFGLIIQFTKREKNLFGGYFSGTVDNYTISISKGLYGEFDRLYFKND